MESVYSQDEAGISTVTEVRGLDRNAKPQMNHNGDSGGGRLKKSKCNLTQKFLTLF